MSEDRELERLRAAFAGPAGPGAPAGACPAAERLWSGARGEAGAEETRALLLHVAACPACAEAWRLALVLDDERPSAKPADEPASAWPRRRAWATLAAAVPLVAAGLWLYRSPRVEPPRYRGETPLAVRALVAEDRPLPRSACVLRWTSGPAGTRYDVRVATEALGAVAHARALEQAVFEVPTQALAALPSGAKLVWQVEAVLPDGSRVVSPAFVARLE